MLIKHLFRTLRYSVKHDIGYWDEINKCNLPIYNIVKELVFAKDVGDAALWDRLFEAGKDCRRQVELLKHAICEEQFKTLSPAEGSSNLSPVNLPDEFIELARTFPIVDYRFTRGVCLLTGKVVNLSENEEDTYEEKYY